MQNSEIVFVYIYHGAALRLFAGEMIERLLPAWFLNAAPDQLLHKMGILVRLSFSEKGMGGWGLRHYSRI